MAKKNPLGGKSIERDIKSIRVLSNLAPVTPTTPTDHGTLTGLSDDDHSQYVHNSSGRTITAQHSFAPGSTQAPFSLGANAQSQLVTGLRADEVNKEIGVSGLGLSGGGILTTNRTITLASSSNPGAAAAVLASDANGGLYLDTSLLAVDGANDLVGIGDATPYYKLDVNGTVRATEYRIGTGDPTYNYLGLTGSDVILHANSGTIEASPILKLRYDTTYVTTLTTNASGNFIVAPYADFVFDPGGNDILPNMAYDLNIGALNKKYLTIHAAELWVETLVAQDTIATIGGRILVGPTTVLADDLPASQTWMKVKHNQMAYNDTCYMEANGKVEFNLIGGRAITEANLASDYFKFFGNLASLFTAGDELVVVGSIGNDGTYTVASATDSGSDTLVYVDEEIVNSTAAGYLLSTGTAGAYWYLYAIRNRDGSGSNDWYAGDAVFNTGTTSDGFIDLYSIGSVKGGTQYGPTIVGNVRNSTTYNDWTEHWAIGNLNGLYGFGLNEFGIGLGKYSGANYVTIDSTNGIRFFDEGDYVRAQLTSTTWTLGRTNTDHVEITTTAISLKDSTTTKMQLQTDGDFFLGSNLAAAGTTYLSIFATAQTYNSESMGAGDMLIGNNSASKANILWDYSEGRLNFRGGTTTEFYIDTTGALVAGGGDVLLDSDGITIATGDSISFPGDTNALKWKAGTTDVFSIWSMTAADQAALIVLKGSNPNLYIQSVQTSTSEADLILTAENTSATAELRLNVTSAATYAKIVADGLKIDQVANDGAVLQLKSSFDIAHGMTDVAETDTYGMFRKASATLGGLYLGGFGEATSETGLLFVGVAGTADTTHSSSGVGVVRFYSAIKDGTTTQAVGTNGNLFSIENRGTTRLIVDAEGDLFIDGSQSSYDDYDDLALIRGFEQSMAHRGSEIDHAFRGWLDERKSDLVKIGIMQPEPGNYFYNVTRLQRLQNGALWQLNQRLERIERMLENYA